MLLLPAYNLTAVYAAQHWNNIPPTLNNMLCRHMHIHIVFCMQVQVLLIVVDVVVWSQPC